MQRIKTKQIRSGKEWLGKEITVKGWVRTVRGQKNFTFIELNDGSELSNLQILMESTLTGYEELLTKITTGAAIAVHGLITSSPGAKQSVEMHAKQVEILGECNAEKYPLQKKRHSFEFLRSIAHLRPRTNTLGAITRVRNRLAYATHTFFQERGFCYLHSPIITLSDCEGAGQMFQVTTLSHANPPKNEKGEIDYTQDFFHRPAFLTVSGQLNGEIYASALSDVYTFGPTFRAENSNTSRHLAEFWMIEPEMAFATLEDNMEIAESYLKTIFKDLLTHCAEDIDLFDKFVKPGVKARLEQVVETPFVRLSYTEAIEILKNCKATFEFPVHWGCDLQSEHERYLAEVHFKSPVIVYNYPKEIKAFYMRANDDGKTVAAMDVLVPEVGEIIGGSQREERLAILKEKMDAQGLDKEHYWWYLELREYGSVPHSGFGAGFERLLLFATGMENIRDVIPFPRFPGHAEF